MATNALAPQVTNALAAGWESAKEAGNWVAGRAKALATDPIGDIKNTLKKTADKMAAYDVLMKRAYGDPKNPLKVTDQETADLVHNQTLDTAMSFMPAGIIAHHGGTFIPGQAIKTRLYTSEDPEFARSYIQSANDRFGNNAGKLQTMEYDVKKMAPESVVLEEAKKHIEDWDMYTPASVFDENLHGDGPVKSLIEALKKKGYDSAEAIDIPYYGTGAASKVHILFPGVATKAAK
jgi:hypothetical protein